MNIITTGWTGYGEIDDNLLHGVKHTIITRDGYNERPDTYGRRPKGDEDRHSFSVIGASVTPTKIQKTEDGFSALGTIHAYKEKIHILLHDKSFLKKVQIKTLEKVVHASSTPMSYFLNELFDRTTAVIDNEELYRFNEIKRHTTYNILLPDDGWRMHIELFRHSNSETTFFLEKPVISERMSERNLREYGRPDYMFDQDVEFAFKPIKDELERRVKLFIKSGECGFLKQAGSLPLHGD